MAAGKQYIAFVDGISYHHTPKTKNAARAQKTFFTKQKSKSRIPAVKHETTFSSINKTVINVGGEFFS